MDIGALGVEALIDFLTNLITSSKLHSLNNIIIYFGIK